MNDIKSPLRGVCAIALLVVAVVWPNHGANAQELASAGERPSVPVRPDVPDRYKLPGGFSGNDAIVQQPATAPDSPAHIQLIVDGPSAPYWTQVEWQGSDGNWHLVTGWQGYTHNGSIRWAVLTAQYGQGPFRWLVYSDDEVAPRASPMFYTPAENGSLILVKLYL